MATRLLAATRERPALMLAYWAGAGIGRGLFALGVSLAFIGLGVAPWLEWLVVSGVPTAVGAVLMWLTTKRRRTAAEEKHTRRVWQRFLAERPPTKTCNVSEAPVSNTPVPPLVSWG